MSLADSPYIIRTQLEKPGKQHFLSNFPANSTANASKVGSTDLSNMKHSIITAYLTKPR
jgi:hypothetical protein